ncbi:GGDEF domain-containing protein [Pseudomonas sp. HR96]|uniref:GGDEF domain-containing protein n=1 Tax=Pseudomonas sp. HR96 TaxID=1027966 RepID=UPI002A759650|nr:GGDEF domain-containing protein [Pseudomonas sp. HR96]WPO97614.1 GGDEF domain-containing protein [Pseudomonas sp. HR96]
MLVPALQPPGFNDPQLLAEVERTITSGVRSLRFSEELEARYEADTHKRRLHFITAVGIGGALIYNLFLISDWLVLNDMFTYVALGRLCLITPMFIVLLLLGPRLKSRRALETVATFGTVTCSVMPLVVMIYSDSPYRLQYQLGMLLIMVYGAMIQQLPFRFTLVALLSMLPIQLLTTYLAHYADIVNWQSNAVFYVSAVLLLLMASWFLERGTRLSYLYALRGRLLHEQLAAIARTDALTLLYNRRYQGEVLEAIWQHAARTRTQVAAILLDIDYFKVYNDSYGHPQGDTCLKELSRVIQRVARERGAMAFRFGGEEFLLLMTDIDARQATATGEALRGAVAALGIPHPVLGEGARVTISLGVAATLAPQASAEELISAADSALYAAKRAGRDCLRSAWPERVGG